MGDAWVRSVGGLGDTYVGRKNLAGATCNGHMTTVALHAKGQSLCSYCLMYAVHTMQKASTTPMEAILSSTPKRITST